ncbi:MAG: TetR/AcrR family transcriptional regulator [Oscillospiraceae bacterium]|jgi:AcrR family transcriptional regulator|nr:TetR/AcrR family transcriptional regulator [Oscillospiraceae bacterium]
MPGNSKREDLRIIKTRKSLTDALHTLLQRCSFSKITVYDLCAEAMVSRSAFYTHFSDKYALLERWLTDLRADFAKRLRVMSAQELEEYLCETFLCNIKVCANLLGEADRELFALLIEYLSPDIGQTAANHKTLSDFLAGGLFCLVIRAVRSGQMSEERLRETVHYAHHMVRAILDWDAEQDCF